jgi:hypothetical protein
MTIRTSLFYAALFMAPAFAGASECRDWQAIVLPPDRTSVQIDVDAVLNMVPAHPADTDPQFVADETKALNEARELLNSARRAMPLGNLTGAWRVASIQVGRTGGFSYPYFAGRIDRTTCGYRFSKTQGSQRRSGVLLPMPQDNRALAFLGSSTVNEKPGKPYGPGNQSLGQPSGPDGPVNSAGRLLRISPDTLLMILDADDKGVELYRLDR